MDVDDIVSSILKIKQIPVTNKYVLSIPRYFLTFGKF